MLSISFEWLLMMVGSTLVVVFVMVVVVVVVEELEELVVVDLGRGGCRDLDLDRGRGAHLLCLV